MNADTERLARAIHERKRMLHEFGPECICTRDAEAILRGAAKIAPPLNVEKIIAEWADRPPEPPTPTCPDCGPYAPCPNHDGDRPPEPPTLDVERMARRRRPGPDPR